MIILKQFDGANVTPADDAALYAHFDARSGIISGVEIAHLGANQISIGSGRGIVCGRTFVIEAETVLATLSTSGTQNGRLLLQLDLGNADAPASFITQAASVLPDLVQEDLNEGGTLYQLVLATYTVSTTTISDLAAVPILPKISTDVLTSDGGTLSKNASFRGLNSASQVSIQSAPTDNGGAGLWMYGIDHANAGQFRLQTYDTAKSKYYQLRGNPDGTLKWDGTLYVNNTADASSTADKNPALILGNRDGEHIVFDGNEIIPKSGATSAGTLYLGDSENTVVSVSGVFRLNSNSYGNSLPTAGTAGRVFFKKV